MKYKFRDSNQGQFEISIGYSKLAIQNNPISIFDRYVLVWNSKAGKASQPSFQEGEDFFHQKRNQTFPLENSRLYRLDLTSQSQRKIE